MKDWGALARQRADKQLALTSWAATGTALLVTAAHFALWALGVTGVVWSYYRSEFWTGVLGALLLILALLAPSASSVVFDLAEGRIRANARKL